MRTTDVCAGKCQPTGETPCPPAFDNTMRSTLQSVLPILLSLCTTLMTWKALCVVSGSPTPIVCVISESMAPTFHRGDILFVWNRSSCLKVGDVPIVWFAGRPQPMVHRIIAIYNSKCGHDQITSK